MNICRKPDDDQWIQFLDWDPLFYHKPTVKAFKAATYNQGVQFIATIHCSCGDWSNTIGIKSMSLLYSVWSYGHMDVDLSLACELALEKFGKVTVEEYFSKHSTL